MAGQVDEIKARVDIVDLISEYIRLKQAGTNFRALCPFHNEKTPSFMVSRDKQIWHCFGCGEGGDIFTFVQKMEGVDFPEALRILAQKAGVKLIAQDPEATSRKNRLLDICQLAALFWQRELLESSEAKKTLAYVKEERKISEPTIEDFKLGYAQDSWDRLINHIKSKGFNDEEIFLAGLAIKKDRGGGFYDRFRDRLMFPINDVHGSPIGFSGRAMKADEKGGKYINTPQTLIYNKSLVIFNLDKAKEFIKKSDHVVVVEGQMDAVSAWQAGTRNVVATSGTAFTLDQLKLLKRYSGNIKIAFDADSAGQQAAKRGIDLALAEEMNVKVIIIPGGKDPDESIRNNPEEWLEALKNAKEVMDYYFEETFSKINLKDAAGKKESARILLPVIAKMGNQIEQTHWLQRLAEKLNVSERVLREALSKQKTEKTKTDQRPPRQAVSKDRGLMLSEHILAIALKFPDNAPYLIDRLAPEVMASELRNLYKNLIIYYTEDIKSNIEEFNYQDFNAKIKAEGLNDLADKLVLLAEKDFFDFDDKMISDELVKALNFSINNYHRAQLKEIEEKIKLAEKSGNQDETKDLTESFDKLVNQIDFLD